jgi:hypothetical protein
MLSYSFPRPASTSAGKPPTGSSRTRVNPKGRRKDVGLERVAGPLSRSLALTRNVTAAGWSPGADCSKKS